jgi:hypothetical protein
MSRGTIKLEIEVNGAVAIDMTDFKNCKDKTKELMNELEMDAENITLKEEEVQTVSTSNNNVNVKR